MATHVNGQEEGRKGMEIKIMNMNKREREKGRKRRGEEGKQGKVQEGRKKEK